MATKSDSETKENMNGEKERDNGLEEEEGGVKTGRIPGVVVGSSISTGAGANNACACANLRLPNLLILASPLSSDA